MSDPTTTDQYDGQTNDQLAAELTDRGLAHTGTKAELLERLRADDAAKADADGNDPDTDDEPDTDPEPEDGDVVDGDQFEETSGRPDAHIVEATTNADGTPNPHGPNPIPDDAATGDIVSQIKRGEVDGYVVVGEQADTKAGDVLVSVDPLVVIARGEAAQELRDNAGQQRKPQRV